MMMSWRDGTNYTMEQAMDKAGAKYRDMLDNEKLIFDPDLASLLTNQDMQVEPLRPYTVNDLIDMMHEGPLLIIRDSAGQGEELATEVVYAVQGDGSPEGTNVYFNSGAGGDEREMNAQQYVDSINNLPPTSSRIRIAHFKKKQEQCEGDVLVGSGTIKFETPVSGEGAATMPDAWAKYTFGGGQADMTVADENHTKTVETQLPPDTNSIPIQLTVKYGQVSMSAGNMNFEGVAKVSSGQN